MQDWNVIVTVRESGFKRAFRFFSEYGPLNKTGFFNVLTLRASNLDRMMDELREKVAEDPSILEWLARVVPLAHRLSFQTGEELESKAREILLPWVPELAGKSFHVRMHRRGMKGKVSSWETERRLNEFLLEELEKAGTPGHISFQDPDAVIALESVGSVAGLSLWTREDLERYPFVRFDTTSKASADRTKRLEAPAWVEGRPQEPPVTIRDRDTHVDLRQVQPETSRVCGHDICIICRKGEWVEASPWPREPGAVRSLV